MLLCVILLVVATMPSADQLLIQGDWHDELPTPTDPLMTFIDINHVNVSWDFDFSALDPTKNVCFAIEYQNNTRYANVSSPICERNHTFYIFPWLLRGQRYRFRVYATDGVTATVSDWTFMFINGIEAPPGPPRNFKTQVLSDTEIILTWNSVLMQTDILAAYDICFNELTPECVDNNPKIYVFGDTYHQFLGLKPATTYYFEIRASLGPFLSVWSDWISATTDISKLPTPSVPLLTFIDINHVNISWDFDFFAVDPAQNVCFVVEYQNNTRYANVSSPICERNRTFYIFPWLLKGQRYRFRVYATDGVMTTVSDWTFTFINGIEAPPGPPQNFKTQVLSDTEIILTWSSVLMQTDIIAYDICFNELMPVCVDNNPKIYVFDDTYHQFLRLKPATTYYFEIRASFGPFYSVWSDWISATTDISKLPTPSVPLLTFIDINHVNISWDFDFSAVDPAQNVCFVIEYQNNTRYANVSSPICERNHTFYIFPWLLRGQRYRFRVYATDGVMTTVSDWSFTFINGIEAPPGPPRNFKTQVISDTEIILTWSGVLMQTDIPVAYDICFNELTPECVDDNPEIFVMGTTSKVLSGLKPDTTYYFEIRASVGPFYSVWSDWISVITKRSIAELPAPSAPEMTFISIGSVNLSWSFDFSAVDPAQNVCFVIEYQNNTRYANVSSPICEGNRTFYIFPWLLRGQRYRFRVYATDGVTTTVSKWTLMFVNGIEAPPGPPQNFRARVWSDTMISLSWEPSVLLSDVSAAYDICFNARTQECVGSPTIFVFGETHRDVVALQPATTYYFEIRASLGPFLSVWSDWISATTYSSTLPVVSLNKNSMTVLSTSVYVQWEPIQKETLEFPFHEYYVYIGMNANDVKVNVEHHMYNYSTINNWFNITGLKPHTNYYIAVSYSVNNTVGNLVLSDGSDIVEITTQYLPPAVQCTVCKGLSEDTVQISWQITSDEDQITKSYVIFNKTDSGEYQRVAGVNNVTSTVYNITGLHPNRGYAFYVQPIADTVNGTKAECPETSCRTKQSVPDPPRNVKIASLNSTSVLVTWDDPIDNKGVISDYTVRYFCANTSQCKNDEQQKTDERSLVVTGLHPFTRYTFVVFAWTIAGRGGNSKPATVRTPEAAPNGAPQLFTSQSFPTSLSLQWLPPLPKDQNGLIIGYQVSWRLSQKDTLLGTANVTSTTYTVVDLEIDTHYKVNVAAFTAAGIGPSNNITAKTTDSEYGLEFSSTSVQSATSKNCKDIKLYWNSLANKDFSYIVLISNYSFEEDENITSDWNYTTQNNFIIITRNQLVVGVVYEAVLEVVVDNSDSPLPEVVTTDVLNISLPACSNPNADDLAFSLTLVQSTTSKNCKDIELHWNLLGDGDFSYIILIHSVENLTSKWNDTTQNDSVIIPRSQLVVGRTYVAELQVVVEYNNSSAPEVVVAQRLNITLPACSKPLDPVLLWSCVGGGAALVVLVLFGVCCAIYCHRRRKYKLLQQVRRPVGGANSSETLKEEEEVTLLGQATDWGSSSSVSSNSSGNRDSDVPMLQVEELDTPSDEISNFGDMSLIERPLPVGAEDS